MTGLDKQYFFTPLNPFGNDPDEEEPHFDCIVLHKVHHQTYWKRKSRCGKLDEIYQDAQDQGFICNHNLRHSGSQHQGQHPRSR